MVTAFNLALVALELGAAGAYLATGEWWKSVYWVAAATITVAVWRM
jgi:hypothetical protein